MPQPSQMDQSDKVLSRNKSLFGRLRIALDGVIQRSDDKTLTVTAFTTGWVLIIRRLAKLAKYTASL